LSRLRTMYANPEFSGSSIRPAIVASTTTTIKPHAAAHCLSRAQAERPSQVQLCEPLNHAPDRVLVDSATHDGQLSSRRGMQLIHPSMLPHQKDGKRGYRMVCQTAGSTSKFDSSPVPGVPSVTSGLAYLDYGSIRLSQTSAYSA
jgi:hypothetical protein